METSNQLACFNMIHQQIRPGGVLDDRVLEVMAQVPRESFVPDAYQGLAYADIEIPIGRDTSMLAPTLVGRLLQALAVQPTERVLELGTGTGYVTACLSRLGGKVVSIEIDPELAAEARDRLVGLGLKQIEIREGNGLERPNVGGPFDAIAVTGSMPTDDSVPMLQDQLAVGGRLFCILGERPAMEAVRIVRVGEGDFRREALFETCAPALAEVTEPEGFEF